MSMPDQLREEGRLDIAKRMLQMEMEEDQIIKITDISAKQLEQLKKEDKK